MHSEEQVDGLGWVQINYVLVDIYSFDCAYVCIDYFTMICVIFELFCLSLGIFCTQTII